MIFWSSGREQRSEELGALTSNLAIELLDASATGCLVECARALAVGTVASLRVTLLDREYHDYVRVVRCQWIPGAGSTYRVGMQFLATEAPGPESLRHAVYCELGRLGGFVQTPPDPADA